MKSTKKMLVVQKEYSSARLKGGGKGFQWIDERVFGDDDQHVDAIGEPISAGDAARAELARLSDMERPEYVRAYRLVQRTVATTDKALAK